MPFTLSHAAAVIPVKKITQNLLPLSALVIGSFSPDFRYFFPQISLGILSHSLTGVFIFCLPLSLITLWLFHAFVKEPISQLLPVSLQSRIDFTTPKQFFLPFNRFVAILVAILIGALTHILWDSFTHEHGWVVESWPLLGTTILRVPAYYDLTGYGLLQHLSTLIGLGLLGFWFRQWFVNAPVQRKLRRMYLPNRLIIKVWMTLLLSSFILGICNGIWNTWSSGTTQRLPRLVVETMIGWMLGFVIVVLIYSLFFKWSGANLFKERFENESAD